MDHRLHDSLNTHLALEFDAAHRYLAMANWLRLQDLNGFARFMATQSEQERGHAARIINHLVERDLQVRLPAIDAPPSTWDSVLALFEDVLRGERAVTDSIHTLVALADELADRPARILLDWFVTEQVEEEDTARGILGRLRLAGEGGAGLLILDAEMGRQGPPADPPA